MLDRITAIPNLEAILVVGILILFGLIETISGCLINSKRTRHDWIQEVGSFFALSSLIKPAIVATVFFVGSFIAPESRTLLSPYNFLVLLIAYLLIDDVMQYWYHRTAHENAFLWKLHRAHHQAEEMGFFVSYRNAALYYVLMPNIWWVGLITFLGGGKAVALGLVLKQLVIISSHSTIKWDAPFYQNRFLQPVVYLLERIIITPAFHHAHHGQSKLDSVSDPNGNFGNMFSFWDQLFGTATFNRAFPKSYGLQNNTPDTWTEAYLYPLVQSKNEKSELSNTFKKEKSTTKEPIFVELEKGEKYLYCQCGLSNTPPFCDGSHHGTKFKPLLFEGKRNGKVKLCNCKLSNTAPYCDNSHLQVKS